MMGDHVAGAKLLNDCIADWEARDRAYDNEHQNNLLTHMYSMKWSFYGDEQALHLAVRIRCGPASFSCLPFESILTFPFSSFRGHMLATVTLLLSCFLKLASGTRFGACTQITLTQSRLHSTFSA